MSAGPEFAFEDFTPGRVFALGDTAVTTGAIIAFAREFDPQPFHLDPEAAKASPLGGLAASGVHTCAMGMRLLYDGLLARAASQGSPGIEELRWLKPVRPGMVLSARLGCLGRRVSKSRSDLGLIAGLLELSDETGDPVMTQRFTAMFSRRDRASSLSDAWPSGDRLEAAPDPAPLEDAAANATRFAPYFDDVRIGARLSLGAHRFEREAMLVFARAYDPQAFHLSDAGAAASHFGRLAASGWMTVGVATRLMVDTRSRVRPPEAAHVPTGPSPGVRDLRWLRPIFVDDVIAFDTVVTAKRDMKQPGWGLVLARSRGVNQRGEPVYRADNAYMLPRRG